MSTTTSRPSIFTARAPFAPSTLSRRHWPGKGVSPPTGGTFSNRHFWYILTPPSTITIAQQVFDSEKHPTLDGVEASKTDAKRMLEAYLKIELAENSKKVIKFAKSAVDLANQLTHDRGATKRDASICLISVTAVASLIKSIQLTGK
jgi:hypothetical protein